MLHSEESLSKSVDDKDSDERTVFGRRKRGNENYRACKEKKIRLKVFYCRKAAICLDSVQCVETKGGFTNSQALCVHKKRRRRSQRHTGRAE